MKFTLEIELGNDAMQTYADIQGSIDHTLTAVCFTAGADPITEVDDGGILVDVNGNRVGEWEVTL